MSIFLNLLKIHTLNRVFLTKIEKYLIYFLIKLYLFKKALYICPIKKRGRQEETTFLIQLITFTILIKWLN